MKVQSQRLAERTVTAQTEPRCKAVNIPDPFAAYSGLIPDFDTFILNLSSPLPPYLRLNTLKHDEEAIKTRLQSEGIRLEKTPVKWIYRVWASEELRSGPSYYLGLTYPQGLSSSLPVLALDVKPGMAVLDMCAAPGGKTTHIAQIMGDTGTILANDRKFGRITALMANIKRLGITNTVISNCRGEFLSPSIKFHRVLVDAPCSGEGRYRIFRDGTISHRKQGSTDLTAIQKGLILKGFDLLRPGGRMVYSTCTINPRENEEVVNHLLKKRDAHLIRWQPPIAWHHGVTEWQGRLFSQELKHCRRFYPHEIDSTGFFVATIHKP